MGRYMIGRQCVKGIQNSENRQGRKKDRMKESVQNEHRKQSQGQPVRTNVERYDTNTPTSRPR